jgi:hypothetical protein
MNRSRIEGRGLKLPRNDLRLVARKYDLASSLRVN